MVPKNTILVILCWNLFAICSVNLVLGHLETSVKLERRDSTNNAADFLQNNNNSIQYLLYTQQNPLLTCYFEPVQSNKCPFNESLETKVLIHGFLSKLLPGNLFEKIKDTLLEYNNYNVIIVNWTKYNGLPYIEAVENSQIVGIRIGEMLNFLISTRRVNSSDIHLIGHSLGAHIAGVAGKHVTNLGRITGLDPAAPLYQPFDIFSGLTEDSADFVDVIHTSIIFGMIEPIGSIDFYANGGYIQPACYKQEQFLNGDGLVENITTFGKFEACNHFMVLSYFMDSIHNCYNLGVECTTYQMYSEGNCNRNSHITNRMGFHCKPIPNLPIRSTFYLDTSYKQPYCSL